ncbi:hypothetical protein J6590_009122 [Homalodisca vitripennis]|nr:hypothetical protein J6590_009122 [Homalodisca vitripennis]
MCRYNVFPNQNNRIERRAGRIEHTAIVNYAEMIVRQTVKLMYGWGRIKSTQKPCVGCQQISYTLSVLTGLGYCRGASLWARVVVVTSRLAGVNKLEVRERRIVTDDYKYTIVIEVGYCRGRYLVFA